VVSRCKDGCLVIGDESDAGGHVLGSGRIPASVEGSNPWCEKNPARGWQVGEWDPPQPVSGTRSIEGSQIWVWLKAIATHEASSLCELTSSPVNSAADSDRSQTVEVAR
jgi:hypothetical protein